VAAVGRAADAEGMNSRILAAAVFGGIAGAWLGRAVFKWLLDVGGTLQLVLILAVAALGLLLGVVSELERQRN
jgi:high-affinity Fe2+/Pb2+ permease